MYRNLLLAALCGLLPAIAGDPQRAPVLVELFTSEGCSSCPPADRLLQQLDARAIVLSEHVDYWDHQGWKDPFSSHTLTQRQAAYGRQFGLDSVYTPEMVIDGAEEFNGSDGARAVAEISRASRRKKAEVRLSRSGAAVLVEVDSAPAPADVLLALAQDSGMSQVSGGENRGRQLRHVAILQSLRKIGSVKRDAAFRAEVELPRAASAQRIIVFLQESDLGRICGAALISGTGYETPKSR